MSVIGFDIGNESCVIAVARSGGVVDVLFLNDESKRKTPAVVSFVEKQRFFGSAAAAFATKNPKSTISQMKRLIGKLYKEVEEDLKLLPFATSEGPRGGILIELEYLKTKWTFTPVEILGMLLKHMKQITGKHLDSAVVDCVIGIPSYFTDLQRRMYLDAANIAGLTPSELMHDGTAIALGYGIYRTDFSESGPTNVMFVDIGHCDTQVTVAAFEPGKMKILSHSFDQNLGGRDFDEVLYHHFAAQFKETYKIDVDENTRASIRLRASCEKVKKVLSVNAQAPLSIKCLIGDTDVRGFITREEFENLSSELLKRVAAPCNMALQDAGLNVEEIDTIELVGSGSRIPAITRNLTKFFKKEPKRTLNSSECVARGCAHRSAMLSPTLIVRDYKIEDSFPYSIALPSQQGDCILFRKGSPFPNLTKMKHQRIIPFYLQVAYIKERDFPTGVSHIVGHFGIGSSEPSDAEKADVEFRVKLNSHGIVEIVSAKISEDKHRFGKNIYSMLLVDINLSSSLPISENLDSATTNYELREARVKEKKLIEQDIKVEAAKDQRNSLESFVYDTRIKLSGAYHSYAPNSEKLVITTELQKTEDWLYEDSDDEYEQDYTERLQILKKLLEPIENRYNEEKAIEKATSSLKSWIAQYHSHADSFPDDKKEKIKWQCGEAERWLRDAVSQNYSPPKTLSSEINRVIHVFQSKCENIVRSKPSFSRNDEHDDSKSAREKAAKPLQTCIQKYKSLAETLPAKKKEAVKNVCRDVDGWLFETISQRRLHLKTFSAGVSEAIDYVVSNCQPIILSELSKHEEPGDSDQGDQIVESGQKEHALDSENARMIAAKALQALIEKYDSEAATFAAEMKKAVKLECMKAENWLHKDAPNKFGHEIEHVIEILQSNCENIVRSKPSFSRNDEHDDKSAREKAAKPLQTCIKKYKSLAETLPAKKKEAVKNVCREADRWLFETISQKRLHLKTFSAGVIETIDFVVSNCQPIILSKSSKHKEPGDSDQGDQIVESGQMEHAVDSENARTIAAKALQALIEKYQSEAATFAADMKKAVKRECVKAENWLHMDAPNKFDYEIKHVIEIFQRNCEYIIRPKSSFPRHEQPTDSNQKDQPIVANQTDQPVSSDQKEQPEDMNQTEQFMQSDKKGTLYETYNCKRIISSESSFPSHEEPVGSDQMDQIVESDQMDGSPESDDARTVATKALQACIAKYRSRAESLPADMKEKVKDECMTAEQWLSSLSRSYSSPNTLATYINRFKERFESNCEGIIRSKPSSSSGR